MLCQIAAGWSRLAVTELDAGVGGLLSVTGTTAQRGTHMTLRMCELLMLSMRYATTDVGISPGVALGASTEWLAK